MEAREIRESCPRGNAVLCIVLATLAMGLGWGIRGQFGHQFGAMGPGAMLGLVLAAWSGLPTPQALRIAAAAALGCAVGGSMTYGQTVGLTKDADSTPYYWWGVLGLAVKGGVWIGLTGAFIGVAASERRYSGREPVLLVLAMAGLSWVGEQLLNHPYDPAAGKLPAIYFSKWFDKKPRYENWGGLWLGFLVLLAYVRLVRRDSLPLWLGALGLLGGAVGFAGGGMAQAWGRQAAPFGPEVQAWFDWWKVMEVGFGLVAGACLAFGWVRAKPTAAGAAEGEGGGPAATGPHAVLEVSAILAWAAWMAAGQFGWGPAEPLWDWPFLHVALLIGFVMAGKWTPFLVVAGLVNHVLVFNTADYLVNEKHAVTGAIAWPIAAVMSFTCVGLGLRLLRRGEHAVSLLILVVWAQTALSALKMLWPPLEGWGQIPTESCFLLIAVAITVLAPLLRHTAEADAPQAAPAPA